MKTLCLIVGFIVGFSISSPHIIVGGLSPPRKPESLSVSGRVVFKQEILPAPQTRKATVVDIQPSAVKEVWQNTAKP